MLPDRSIIQEEFDSGGAAYDAQYVALDELTPAERTNLPALWEELVTSPDPANRVADLWTTHCPNLPSTARYLREHLLGVSLVRMNRPAWWDARIREDDESSWPEIALMYYARDLSGRLPFTGWYGWPPYSGELPPHWPSVEPVLGNMAQTLHDGFLNAEINTSGIVPVLYEREVVKKWFDSEDIVFWSTSDFDTRSALVGDHRPDPHRLIILAEYENSTFAVDTNRADGAGWAENYDRMFPVNLASEIDDLIGRLAGADDSGASKTQPAPN